MEGRLPLDKRKYFRAIGTAKTEAALLGRAPSFCVGQREDGLGFQLCLKLDL